MISTQVQGKVSFMCGNFYHQVNIYRDDKLIDTLNVHCCEDDEEASYYAITISNKLTKEEKDNYVF